MAPWFKAINYEIPVVTIPAGGIGDFHRQSVRILEDLSLWETTRLTNTLVEFQTNVVLSCKYLSCDTYLRIFLPQARTIQQTLTLVVLPSC